MQPEPSGFIQQILLASVRCFFVAKSINVKTFANALRVLNPRLRASCKNCSFVVVVVIAFCVLVYGAKVLRKKVKKILFAIVFVISFCYARALVLRLWSLVVACVPAFGRGRSGACVPALVASCAILLTSAKWERTHAPTRIHIYTRNNF